MNRWLLTKEIKEKIKPLLIEYFEKVENTTNNTDDFRIDLSDKGINPYQLWQLLEEDFNYQNEDIDNNGWEQDFWIYMKRIDGKHFISGCENLVIRCCGMTFKLELYINDIDF